jgi:hypothetical protein
MATRNAQTHAKRARELAVRERRERKRAKKAAQRAGGTEEPSVDEGVSTAPQRADDQADVAVADAAAASEDGSERPPAATETTALRRAEEERGSA